MVWPIRSRSEAVKPGDFQRPPSQPGKTLNDFAGVSAFSGDAMLRCNARPARRISNPSGKRQRHRD
jgi:hypothetical protein